MARVHTLALRVAGAAMMVGTLTGSLTVSCAGDPSSTTGGGGTGSNAPASSAMGQWIPTLQDTCTKAFHDTFFVVGPDGKKYPTWHRPEEPVPGTNTTCSFGHEHGLDPSGSALWNDLKTHFARSPTDLATSGIPFGYVAEQLTGSTTPRIEEHTAYKVTHANGVDRTAVSGGNQFDVVTCDLFAVYNQPTSTADAFASNMFSVTYGVNCNAGASQAQYPIKAIASVMALYQDPGSFTQEDGTALVVNQAPVPAASPNSDGNELGRRIATDDALFPTALVVAGQTSTLSHLIEQWQTQVRLRRADFTDIARFSPSFRVDDPARYYSIGDGALARTIDLCYSGLNSQGVLVSDPNLALTIVKRVRNEPKCAAIAPNGPSTPVASRIAHDSPQNPFRGCARVGIFGAETVANRGGPSTWYTTPFGENASTASFANSVKQMVASEETNSIVLAAVQFGQQSSCLGTSVHVPN